MLNSRILVNLFLLLVLAVFIFLLINKEQQLPESYKLTSLSLNDIHTIKIPRADGQPILLEKNNIWIMKSPYQIRAHQFRINTLLNISQLSSETQYDASQLKLSEYGLQPARASIVFNDTEIHFGKSNPVNGKRYLLNDNNLFLILDDTYPLVSAHATSLIDLKLIDSDKSLTSIELPDFSLIKTNNGQWQSTSSKLNPEKIATLLEHWNHAQAYAVHRQSTRNIIGQIKLGFKDETISLHIAEDDNWLILIRTDLNIEYHLDPALKQKLLDPDHA